MPQNQLALMVYDRHEQRSGFPPLMMAIGDEVEVHLPIRARHPAKYIHLRDPRPLG